MNRGMPHWPSLGLDPEKVLEHLWQSSLIGFTLIDEKDRWLHPSATMCQLLEYTSAELESMTYQQITHPADVKSDESMAKSVARGEIPYYVMSKRYITKTGKVIWIKLHVSAFFDEETGKFVRYFSQIAPAEVWDPKTPVVKKEKPIEVRVADFWRAHWKYLLPMLGAALVGSYKVWEAYSTLMELAAKK